MKHLAITIYATIVCIVLFSACKKDNNNEAEKNEKNEPKPTVDIVWKSSLSCNINPSMGYNYMPAVDENDNIYVMMIDWTNQQNGYVLQALDINGSILWTKSVNNDGVHRQMVTYYKGMLFYATKTKIMSLNASTGDELWSFACPDTLSTTQAMAISNQQLITVFSGNFSFYSHVAAIDPFNGNLNAMQVIGNRGEIHAIAAMGNDIYLTYNKIIKMRINSATIDLTWQQLLPNNTDEFDITYRNMYNDVVIDPDNGNIYFTYGNIYMPNEKWLIAYDLNGNKLWESASFAAEHITVDQGNALYVSNGKLVKLNGNNGKQIWTANPPDVPAGSAFKINSVVHGSNDVMYCGDYYGLCGINNAGAEQFKALMSSITTDDTPFTYVTLLSNGDIIVLAMAPSNSSNSPIYRIKNRPNSGVKASIWAKWGANRANTFNLLDFKKY